ncbi:hypothetical protein [uncultured Hyphomicrobium sp.]|uniref:hypothetical protein n=1 Tax=uncultured Hyphomicrobium sp. TaxID=194373 RepID=UPI0025D6B9B9|nr:hypothetical protein [uncultured Hyphomicrobium sp.]
MLYKAIGIILTALFIASFQISAASAGCGGHGGFHAYQSKAPSRVALQQSRARKAALAEARAKQKKAAQIARAEKKAEAAKVAAAESTPKTEETTTVAEEAKDSAGSPLNVASAAQTCTKFVAETGTTVTIECAKQ